jgi:MFS family permease
MVFGGVFVGKITDDCGPGIPLAIGAFLHVLGLMIVSNSNTYFQIILSQAVCSAIGSSMVFYPAVTCVSRFKPLPPVGPLLTHTQVSTWFLKKRGAALGIVVMGSSFGGVIFPVMLIQLIPKVGFGWAMRICAFIILALLIVANLTIRSRIPPVKRPFSIMALFRPLAELDFLLLTLAIFFFYCKDTLSKLVPMYRHSELI